jgi:UDP-N-acetylglucosamine 2-epimerase
VTTHCRKPWTAAQEYLQRNFRFVKHPHIEIAWLLHLNPQVQQVVRKMVSGKDRIHLLPPLDYLEFLSLMKISHFMISDSGGVQEEGPSFSKPVLVLRNVTERPEGVYAGINKLVGTDHKNCPEASL